MAEGIGILICRLPQNADDPHGTVQCLVPSQFKARILSTPGFPKAPLQVSTQRLGMKEMGTGNELKPRQGIRDAPQIGVFTEEDIEAGELLVDERPIMIVSQKGETPNIPNLTRTELQQIMTDRMNKCIEIAGGRMDPVKQSSFLFLKNSHTEGMVAGRPFLGRVLTNVLECGLDWGGTRYGGVCTILSRVNHRYVFRLLADSLEGLDLLSATSCSPNTAYTFDPVSLSFQLWAVRKISAGEELTFAYADLAADYAERLEPLLRYGFICTCPACLEPKQSDIRRRAALDTKARTLEEIKQWIKSKTASDDFLIAPAMKHLEMMEKEGLEALGELVMCRVGFFSPTRPDPGPTLADPTWF
jgi:hypothetical protein